MNAHHFVHWPERHHARAQRLAHDELGVGHARRVGCAPDVRHVVEEAHLARRISKGRVTSRVVERQRRACSADAPCAWEGGTSGAGDLCGISGDKGGGVQSFAAERRRHGGETAHGDIGAQVARAPFAGAEVHAVAVFVPARAGTAGVETGVEEIARRALHPGCAMRTHAHARNRVRKGKPLAGGEEHLVRLGNVDPCAA